MHGPPPDPRAYRTDPVPTWSGILVAYAMVAAVFFTFWAVSQPLVGTVAIAGFVGLGIGARRVGRLVRCFVECGGFVLEFGGTVRVCVTRPESEIAC